ncbi:MAG: hypothetical protein ABIJ97_03600 [Bacteroidota bacterium]
MKKLKEVFKIFQNKESFFDQTNNKKTNSLIINQIIVICLFAFAYGLVMGSYHSIIQSVVSGIKVIVLFLSTLIICFPSFYIIQQVLGSKMSSKQMIMIILNGFVLISTITLSFAPIVIFFILTGGNYHFLQLLHVAIFIFGGVFGMKLIIESLKYACEKKNIYPQMGVTVFRVWIIILAFVGMQLAWNLRPFLSDKAEEFKLFRTYKGNFYTAVIYSVGQLIKDKETINSDKEEINPSIDTVTTHKIDTNAISIFFK